MSRRRLAQPGLSYLDANAGRLVTIENDVLGIKREIEERWPELRVYIDKDQCPPRFVVTEMCKDNVERLILEREYLDQRLLDDLLAADSSRRGQEDPVAIVDAYNAQVEKRQEEELMSKLGEAHERLLFALKKDGLGGIPKVSIPNKPETMCS